MQSRRTYELADLPYCKVLTEKLVVKVGDSCKIGNVESEP